jgi:PAS domain S-box-containing protein
MAAALAAFFHYDIQTGSTVRLSALFILYDTAEVLTAALCLSYAFGGTPRLNSVRALAKFSLFAVILAPLLRAFFVAVETEGNYWVNWRISFFSEAIVYLTLMPAILGWFSKGPAPDRKSPAYYLEAAALIVGLVVFGYLAFAAPGRYSSEARLYSLVPFLLWAALRFGSTGVSTSAIAIAVVAIWGATHGRGPFIELGPLNNVLSLQLFLFFAAAPFMVLAAVVEENKQASEQLFRSIFENAQIGISVFGTDGREHSSNRAMHEMLGYTEEELSRLEQWDTITHPDERASCAERYAQLLQGKRDQDEWEQRFIHRDGRTVVGNGRFSLLRDAMGKPRYVVALSEDITKRRRAEAELLTAKEAAEAATRAKSDFLANMSHEVRTPMNAIIGMTHLALKTELTPKQEDYLSKIKAAADALLGIINDILDFSKIEAGKLDIEKTDFRLEDVLANLSTVVSQKAQDKNLEFLISAQDDLPAFLVGDPLRLGQVLINLVNNAVKFTERGEVAVSVTMEERASDRVKLKFSVRDTGIGVTPEQAALLYQPFSQADTSTTRKYGGTGLGLSISKRLVEMMGGNIWVESEFGQGSTFSFNAWFGVRSAVIEQKGLMPGLAGIRALVVDDNALAREILTDALRRFTIRAECASSSDDALRELAIADSQDPYQLVLIDWQMPGTDGLETSRIIKGGGHLKNVPKIVMITAFGREDIRVQAEEITIEGLLQKPVSPSVLYDTLMSLFGVAGEGSFSPVVSKRDIRSHLVNGIRVLLVEDNEVNQQVARELLESEGASVKIANHGGEAVEILTGGDQPPPFDVVLMDLQMPEMDGIAATRLLRSTAQLRELPIIAMTAHAMTEEVQRCLEVGMNDHVGKPIDPDAFFATVARWTCARGRNVSDLPAEPAGRADELFLPEIEGVDVVGGLQRVAGNRRLYRDLLSQFATKQGSAGERIAAAIESGDHRLAERLAHSLKGAAGNIGINHIFHSAGRLEGAIRESRGDVPLLVKGLSSMLDRQAQAIQQALRVATPIPAMRETHPMSDPTATLAAVARLRVLLETNDADAPEAFSTLAEALKGAVDAARLDALRAAVNGFDFDRALSKLVEIIKECGANWKTQ